MFSNFEHTKCFSIMYQLKRTILHRCQWALVCLCCLAMASCGDRKSSAADSGTPERVDSLAQRSVGNDSLETFVSKDLSTFWLRGRVKQVVETTESGYTVTLQFDREGNLVSHSAYNTKKSEILRDLDNRIISMVNIGGGEQGNSGMDFSYDADGIVANLSHWAESHDTYQYVDFTPKGWPLKGNIADENDDYSGKVHYKYPKVDSCGNWLEQVAYESWPDIEETAYVVKRRVSYYE